MAIQVRAVPTAARPVAWAPQPVLQAVWAAGEGGRAARDGVEAGVEGGRAGAEGGWAGVHSDGATPGLSQVVGASTHLCVFDYHLTLSSHDCPHTHNSAAHFCRDNGCDTYGWYTQCLGRSARDAVAQCVEREAYIGIASHANVDACWNDKVLPIVAQGQFPEFVGSPFYDNPSSGLSYPAIDDRSNWNCVDCAYHMDAAVGKPDGIIRIMLHYAMDPESPADQARAIFWDDTPSNISATQAQLPGVKTVLVPRHGENGDEGGCGIGQEQICAGWAL